MHRRRNADRRTPGAARRTRASDHLIPAMARGSAFVLPIRRRVITAVLVCAVWGGADVFLPRGVAQGGDACCLPDGQCQPLTPQDCVDQGGEAVGPPDCGPPTGCCLPEAVCINTDPRCCEQIGGRPNEPPCEDKIQACCLPDGNCLEMTLQCCQLYFGIPFPGICGEPEACCRFAGECQELHPLCCIDSGATPQGPGTTCAADGCPPPPFIVHADGLPGETRPCSGYIDPRAESSNGIEVDQGISEVTIVFNEPVFAVSGGGGGPLTPANFAVGETGGGQPPVAIAIDASDNPEIIVALNRPITLGEWTTLYAVVQNAGGVLIENLGNLGPVDEPDRVDIGFLPCDVDQDGACTPFDLLRFRQYVYGLMIPECGLPDDYVDLDRDGAVSPFDLLAFRRLVTGVPPATRPWAGAALSHPRP